MFCSYMATYTVSKAKLFLLLCGTSCTFITCIATGEEPI
ncbi:hypothetical protein HMPREF1248_1556 [Coriobacteriaceae bacterium BV3Ac1]|nr:hypothetical protein HMPREF1248_1556 [Coriobacteriaceae bacterium BV3Ac1]